MSEYDEIMREIIEEEMHEKFVEYQKKMMDKALYNIDSKEPFKINSECINRQDNNLTDENFREILKLQRYISTRDLKNINKK